MTSKAKTALNRRDLIKGAGVVGGAALLAGCGQTPADCPDGPIAASGEKRELKMVTTWPKNFPGLGTGAQRIADRITAMTGGRLAVHLYAANELVPALGAFDAVAQGKADMYHGAEYYWQGKSVAFNFFAAVPFGMTAQERSAWVRFGGGQELWDELAAGFNVKPFPGGSSGTQMGGWFKKPINSLDDLQGLKIRMPGLGGEVFKRLGATPVTKAGGEIYQALDQGVIDATEWIGPWNDLAFGLHELAKYYYHPGIHEPGTSLSAGMNLDLWNSLSDADKAVVQAACDAENDVMFAEFNANNGRALKTLVEDHDVILSRFSDEVLKELQQTSAAVVQEVASRDPMAGRVYESFSTARTDLIGWGEVGEQAFIAARAL